MINSSIPRPPLLRIAMLALFFVFVSLFRATAQDLHEYLVVEQLNGVKTVYMLDEQPKVSFDDVTLKIECRELADEYPIDDVVRFTFDKLSMLSSVNEPVNVITVRGNDVKLAGFAPGLHVMISDIQGRVLFRTITDMQGETAFSIAGLGDGIYIVSTSGGKSFKIFKY